MQAVHVAKAGHMACLPSPSPAPSRSMPTMTLVQQAIRHLGRRKRQDALDAILAIGDGMHDIFAKTGGVAADLRQVNRLFLSVVQHAIYGIRPQADRTINHLLLLSIRKCETLRTPQIQAAAPPRPDTVGWLSSAHADELNEHLELYRNVLAYIASHPASRPAGSHTQDPRLKSAQHILQRLCPRINNLARWTYTPPAPTAPGPAGIRKTRQTPQRRGARRSSHPPGKPTTHARQRPPLPTPPTQTGDAANATIVATAIVKLSDTQPPATPSRCRLPVSVGLCGCHDGVGERREVEGWVEEATQLVEAGGLAAGFGSTAGTAPGLGGSCYAQAVVGRGVGEGFRLRPGHVPSARCCWWGVTAGGLK